MHGSHVQTGRQDDATRVPPTFREVVRVWLQQSALRLCSSPLVLAGNRELPDRASVRRVLGADQDAHSPGGQPPEGCAPGRQPRPREQLRDYLIRAKGPHARLPPLIFHRGTRIAIAQACRLLGLDLVHTKPGHCNFPAQIHLDVASMSQSPAWDYLGQMTGTRILIDL